MTLDYDYDETNFSESFFKNKFVSLGLVIDKIKKKAKTLLLNFCK